MKASFTLTWKTQAEYTDAVRRRVGARALLEQNTLVNPRGPQPGDLMSSVDHTALVFRVYPPGVSHPRATDTSIPLFPGQDVARTQLNQTEYFREVKSSITAAVHFDYLNHRGLGKQQAELIYFANRFDMTREGYQYRMYGPGVIDNWTDWNGEGDPPR